MDFAGLLESSSAKNLDGSEPRDDVRLIGPWPRTDHYVALLSAYLADAAALRSTAASAASHSSPADDSSPVAEGLTHDGSYLLHFLGIESLPASSEGQVTDNAETNTDVSANRKPTSHQEQFESEHASTESKTSSQNHNTQETSVESGSQVHNNVNVVDQLQNDSFKNPSSSNQSKIAPIHSWGTQDCNIDNTSFNGGKDMHMPPYYRGFNYRVLYYPMNDDIAPSPDLCARIVKQIEYYFSFDNLIKDRHFRQHMDHQGWVPIQFIAALPQMRELTNSIQVIVEALRTSLVIEILDDTKIRRHCQRRTDLVRETTSSKYDESIFEFLLRDMPNCPSSIFSMKNMCVQSIKNKEIRGRWWGIFPKPFQLSPDYGSRQSS